MDAAQKIQVTAYFDHYQTSNSIEDNNYLSQNTTSLSTILIINKNVNRDYIELKLCISRYRFQIVLFFFT